VVAQAALRSRAATDFTAVLPGVAAGRYRGPR
jgi:hypothetical protein